MDITSKLWSFCHILRHDGVDSADYIEQLTYLLFLEMSDENEIAVPEECRWKHLIAKSGVELKEHYELTLERLKGEQGMLGQIFQEPISKIKNPISLKKIIDGIEGVGWTKLEKDVQGEAFEGLLEKTANEGKKGAGQFFTPRPLIQAIVNVTKPNPLESKDFRISDTSCGTGGFLTVAVDWAKKSLPLAEWSKVRDSVYYGQELVVRPYRLALMNLFLHGVKANISLGDSIYGINNTKNFFDCIITNPPFGSRGVTGPPKDRGFPVETSNIQINFIQHIYELVKPGGRVAMVLPDGALSDIKAKEVWRNIIGKGNGNVHTILRLPKGTFNPYANGVKASVVFFQKGEKTKSVWVYDARTNVADVTKSSRPLNYKIHFEDFVDSFGPDPNGKSQRKRSQRFEEYSIEEVVDRGFDLSFNKVYNPPSLKEPIFYVDGLIKNFEQQLEQLHNLKKILSQSNNE